MLFVVGFIVTFVIGGLTGVMLAARAARPPAARHLLRRRPLPLRADRRRGVPAARDPHLLVPEDHRPDDERDARQDQLLARSSSASTSPSSRCTSSGMLGMPRRVYTYPAGLGWRTAQPALHDRRVRARARRCCCSSSTCSSRSIAARVAGPNPWGAPTLEWATSSPPPVYNFAAHSRSSTATRRCGTQDDELPVVTGLRVDQKEMLLTTVVDATPDTPRAGARSRASGRSSRPAPSESCSCASIFSPWALAVGLIPCAIALTAWFWPKEPKRHPEPVIDMIPEPRFTDDLVATCRPTSSVRAASPGGGSSASW